MTIYSRRKTQFRWQTPAGWLLLALIAFIILFPLWWALRTALTDARAVFTNPTSLWPSSFTLNNFARVLGLVNAADSVAMGGAGSSINFLLSLRNSLIVAALSVTGQILFSAMAAFAFARLDFPGRNQLFGLFVAALLVPSIVMLIPNFILIRELGLMNTFGGIVGPKLLMTPLAVFFFRQTFLGIHREIEDAAKIDGANHWQVFVRLVMPMSMTAITTLAILAFIGEWNEYLWPFLVGREEEVRVLTVALGVFRSQTPQGAPDWSGLMAGAIVAVLPTLVLFLLTGRKAVDAIQFSGIK